METGARGESWDGSEVVECALMGWREHLELVLRTDERETIDEREMADERETIDEGRSLMRGRRLTRLGEMSRGGGLTG